MVRGGAAEARASNLSGVPLDDEFLVSTRLDLLLARRTIPFTLGPMAKFLEGLRKAGLQ